MSKESDVQNPRVLHRTYSDVCGPMQTQTRSGYRYFITFIDGHSHHLVVQLMKTKDETIRHTQTYIERAEAETGERVNLFRSDGGGEYGSHALKAYFERKGIHHEKTNAYTPQENGVSERMNRTIMEMARSMLQD
ncbi:DDE-type integrase/transposase/recombinase, partial [Escherichia coli]|uniref:DDE-type integrase/transposase/recombinase n=1 Tax=Escherichia coli TaxID=562 RepID=UPI002864C1AA